MCLRFSKLLKTFLADNYHFEAPHQVLSGHKQHRKHQSLIPEYHRVVATEPQSGEYKKLPPLQHGELDGEESDPEPGKQEGTQAFGIYHTPSQFISRALLVQHPFDSRFSVEDVTRRNLFDMLTKGQSYVAKARLEFARMIAVLSKELACEEARFQASLPEHVQVVVKGKRILLYKHLLKHFGCPDLELAELMTGTNLVGVATKSPFLETKLVPASTTPEFALLSSRWQRKKLEAVDIHESDPELSKVLWETTLQEVDAGFLQGPFHDLQQVKSMLGVKDVVCSRRFAIMQSGKPRIIDDFKLSGVNKAYTSVDQLKLHDVDYLSSLCHLITSTIRKALDREDQLVRITLSDNSVLEAPLHNDFCGKLQWKGKCLDLSKAYKQMPISVQSRKFAVLIVHHFQTKEPVYFLSRSLPFGACSSVYSFYRVSRGIWYLASHGCKAMGGVYFDDFPFLEPSSLCTLASQSIEGLLKALGWTYTTDPSKCYPFSESFDVLGARLSVGGLHGQSFSLQNKPGRLDKIAEHVSEVQRNKTITKRQAQAIHGNMNFAMSFVMGHTLKVAARAFSALSTDACVYSKKQLVSLCIWTKEILTFLSPRTIDPKGPFVTCAYFHLCSIRNGYCDMGRSVHRPPYGD